MWCRYSGLLHVQAYACGRKQNKILRIQEQTFNRCFLRALQHVHICLSTSSWYWCQHCHHCSSDTIQLFQCHTHCSRLNSSLHTFAEKEKVIFFDGTLGKMQPDPSPPKDRCFPLRRPSFASPFSTTGVQPLIYSLRFPLLQQYSNKLPLHTYIHTFESFTPLVEPFFARKDYRAKIGK